MTKYYIKYKEFIKVQIDIFSITAYYAGIIFLKIFMEKFSTI